MRMKWAMPSCLLLLPLLLLNLHSTDSYRLVKSRYGDDLRKWDLHELLALGPYPYGRIIDDVRKRYQIPSGEPIKLRYRDGAGDWITMEEGGDAYMGRENLYVEVVVGSTTPAPGE